MCVCACILLAVFLWHKIMPFLWVPLWFFCVRDCFWCSWKIFKATKKHIAQKTLKTGGLHRPVDLLVRDKAHSRLVLSNFPSADLLPGATDGREDDVAKDCNPMHTLRCQVLDGTIKGIIGVRSQTLEQCHPRCSCLLHV